MGQYYSLYNRSKNERVEHDFNTIGGMKLTEHSYVVNNLAVFLRKKLANEWSGDRIYHIGDYASPNDGTSTASKMWADGYEILSNATSIKCPASSEDEQLEYPYIINHDKKKYVDIRDVDVCNYWVGKNGDVWLYFFDPLLLLTACGNGQGDGDYFGFDGELIGSWAGDRISASDTKPEGYEVLVPHFHEGVGLDPQVLKNHGKIINHGIEGDGYQKWISALKMKVDLL